MLKILHIGPPRHGIAAYDRQIEAIYRRQGFEVEPILVDEQSDLPKLSMRIAGESEAVCHFEIGSGDSAIFQLSRTVLKRTGRPQLVTLHDPGVGVRHPLNVAAASSELKLVRLTGKAARKLTTKVLGARLIDRHLQNPLIHRVYLRPDLAGSAGSYYLPQPTYHPELPAAPESPGPPWRIGFGGYWGHGKGLETLIEAATRAAAGGRDFQLVLAGGGASSDDKYVRSLRDLAKKSIPTAELPGFVEDDQLDDFLQGLTALVLPYWPELPNGTSAMAMRAAELAVPIIASDTPALSGQLGRDGAQYVEPRDVEALQRAIEQLLDSPAQFQTVARRTQQQIFEGHNWSVVGKKLRELVGGVTGVTS